MDKIKLGKTELDIAPIIFGGNVFGWTLDEKASFDILDEFLDYGFNAIDTANNYSFWIEGNQGGESETILGKWIAERKTREEIILMTKVGGPLHSDGSPNTTTKHILEQVDKSLERLQTDYIDLYQTHFDDESTPVDEALRAYDDLIQAGKVRYIGASNISPSRLEESLSLAEKNGLPRYDTLQPQYNLYDRQQFEEQYQDLASQHGLAVIPYYSLASGFLSGKYLTEDDFSKSARGQGVKDQYWNDRGKKLVTALSSIAEESGVSSSALALAWLLRQPTVAAPIASATKPPHLKAFADAVDLRLSDEKLNLLKEASSY